MATGTVKGRQGASSPFNNAGGASDARETTVTIRLSGTPANQATDWATLIAQSFASTAVIEWRRS